MLGRPVISIGNIAMGGRAKTPMAALVARALIDAGERPAVLSRGYGRARAVDAPVVVRDTASVRATLAESGDEPLMLAEQLDGAIVVVAADRARAAASAEQLGATVHILDDGFQHVRVARDIDIVMIDASDLRDAVVPAGRLREPVDALRHADAVVLISDRPDGASTIAEAIRFVARRQVGPPPAPLTTARGFLVSGIADHGQFAAAVRESNWRIVGEAPFGDHHRYTFDDAEAIARQAGAAGAEFVLTTAKDAVRLREVLGAGLPMHVAPMELALDDRAGFEAWLTSAVSDARRARADAARRRLEDGARRAS